MNERSAPVQLAPFSSSPSLSLLLRFSTPRYLCPHDRLEHYVSLPQSCKRLSRLSLSLSLDHNPLRFARQIRTSLLFLPFLFKSSHNHRSTLSQYPFSAQANLHNISSLSTTPFKLQAEAALPTSSPPQNVHIYFSSSFRSSSVSFFLVSSSCKRAILTRNLKYTPSSLCSVLFVRPPPQASMNRFFTSKSCLCSARDLAKKADAKKGRSKI